MRTAVNQPPAMRARPITAPSTTRIAGVMRLFWKEYFTRKTTPRKRTKPPSQANSFTPRKASQSIAGRADLATGGLTSGGGVGATIGSGGGAGVGCGAGWATDGSGATAAGGAVGDSSAATRWVRFFIRAWSTRRRAPCFSKRARARIPRAANPMKPQVTRLSMIDQPAALIDPLGRRENPTADGSVQQHARRALLRRRSRSRSVRPEED